MTDERQNLLVRREILVAYTRVLDRLEELLSVCASAGGDAPGLRRAVQETFGLSEIAAEAVLSMQVRRFTPTERQKIQEELAGLDVSLERISVAQTDRVRTGE